MCRNALQNEKMNSTGRHAESLLKRQTKAGRYGRISYEIRSDRKRTEWHATVLFELEFVCLYWIFMGSLSVILTDCKVRLEFSSSQQSKLCMQSSLLKRKLTS